MLKNMSQLEHIIADRVYHFTCDATSPISEVKDALFQFLKYVGNIEDQIKANQAAQAAPEQTSPEVPVSDSVPTAVEQEQ